MKEKQYEPAICEGCKGKGLVESCTWPRKMQTCKMCNGSGLMSKEMSEERYKQLMEKK